MKMQRLLVASVVFISALSLVGCGEKKEAKKSKAPAEASHTVKSYDKPVNPSEPVGQNSAPNSTSATAAVKEPEGLSYIPPIEETATSTTTVAPSTTAPANSLAQPGASSSVNSAPVNANAQAGSPSNASLNTSAPSSVSASGNNAPINSSPQLGVTASATNAPINSSAQSSGPATANNAQLNPTVQPSVSGSANNASISSTAQPASPGNITPINSQVPVGASSASPVVELHQGQTSGTSAVSHSSPVVTGAAATSSASTPLKSAQ